MLSRQATVVYVHLVYGHTVLLNGCDTLIYTNTQYTHTHTHTHGRTVALYWATDSVVRLTEEAARIRSITVGRFIVALHTL